MLHDQVFSSADSSGGLATEVMDRRRGCRVPFPAELVLIWHHDLSSAVRYRIVDASDGGFRIISTLPLVEGMTGMALKVLPGGALIDQTVCVTWIRPREEECASGSGGYEIGLRYF